ncbi:MAG TPA: imidazolonepropionase [Candidatus Nanopelagicales bacterium]|nr:imidazolonepropionase [Candidatus Nanopelagicales bacterium]
MAGPGDRRGAATAIRGLLVVGAAEVATLAGGVRRGAAQADPAIAPPGTAIACLGERIVAVAPQAEASEALGAALEAGGHDPRAVDVLDASGATVTPGLVDAHTHLLFAGSREDEVAMRARGATYLEILAAGGGILSTVRATRAASDAALLAHGRRWLAQMLRTGTTTVEAKSGYGLDTATELRLLAAAGRLTDEGPVDVVPTFLGAHAVPPEIRAAHPGDPAAATEAYVASVIAEQLPAVAAQGIARSCDVFCEAGVFTATQSRRILLAARALGLDIRLHADELAPSGGAELAAELGALSADHLGAPSAAGIAALAAAAAGAGRPVVAVLLPTVPWFLGLEAREPARELIEAGVPVALATDFNPGTSPVTSLPLVMTAAVLMLRLDPAEALAATTVNAATALGLADRGALVAGLRADLVAWDVSTHAQIPYWAGADLARAVVAGGRVAGGRVVGR